MRTITILLAIMSLMFGSVAMAAETCVGAGPQTPRDIDQLDGENPSVFSLAPHIENMNLCNLHYHVNAEHKAFDFSVFSGVNEGGVGGGYKCNAGDNLPPEQSVPFNGACQDTQVGNTIEVHWVYTSCDVEPGLGLEACTSIVCANPNLRVESQVFLLVNCADGACGGEEVYSFKKLSKVKINKDGYYQVKELPEDTGAPVRFIGSTTGPSYNNNACSPLQVSWSVRPRCAKLDIKSLSKWCEDNEFGEDKAHGVRILVTPLELLAPIK